MDVRPGEAAHRLLIKVAAVDASSLSLIRSPFVPVANIDDPGGVDPRNPKTRELRVVKGNHYDEGPGYMLESSVGPEQKLPSIGLRILMQYGSSPRVDELERLIRPLN